MGRGVTGPCSLWGSDSARTRPRRVVECGPGSGPAQPALCRPGDVSGPAGGSAPGPYCTDPGRHEATESADLEMSLSEHIL